MKIDLIIENYAAKRLCVISMSGAGHGGPQYSSPELLKIMIDFLNQKLR